MVLPPAISRLTTIRPAAPAGPVPASLLLRVHLTKQEVFAACQALADADPVLVAAGGIDQARALADLFELLEDRLTGPRAQAATMYAPGAAGPPGQG